MDYDFLHFRVKLLRRPSYTFLRFVSTLDDNVKANLLQQYKKYLTLVYLQTVYGRFIVT